MLIVAKRIFRVQMCFSTFSQRLKNAKTSTNTADKPIDNDLFKTYRNKVEKSSILRQFRQEVFRRTEINSEWQAIKKK